MLLSPTIDRKTSAMSFVLYAMLLGDAMIGTFYDMLDKYLNSSAGVALFAVMSIAAFGSGFYVLRRYMAVFKQQASARPSFFGRLSKAIPYLLLAILAIFVVVILQMLLYSSYSSYLLIPVVIISGAAASVFLGFRACTFLAWFKSSKRNYMMLSFAVSSILFAIAMATTVPLDSHIILLKPASITPESSVTNDISKYVRGTDSLFFFYAYVIPVVITIVPESAGIAFFLLYFRDKIGRATFWTVVILPSFLLLFGDFVPQIIAATSSYVYASSHFTLFRVMGSVGWPAGDFIHFIAFLLVARTVRKVVAADSGSNNSSNVINYLLIAAFASLLLSPTLNNWITSTTFPPFGMIQRGFLVMTSLVFSMGVYSAAVSVSEDAKLRQSIRKLAKQSLPLATLGDAQMHKDIQGRVIKLVREQQASMTRETGIESSMTDNDIKQYLELAVAEAKSKDSSKSVT
jgi:hypothetical protein